MAPAAATPPAPWTWALGTWAAAGGAAWPAVSAWQHAWSACAAAGGQGQGSDTRARPIVRRPPPWYIPTMPGRTCPRWARRQPEGHLAHCLHHHPAGVGPHGLWQGLPGSRPDGGCPRLHPLGLRLPAQGKEGCVRACVPPAAAAKQKQSRMLRHPGALEVPKQDMGACPLAPLPCDACHSLAVAAAAPCTACRCTGLCRRPTSRCWSHGWVGHCGARNAGPRCSQVPQRHHSNPRMLDLERLAALRLAPRRRSGTLTPRCCSGTGPRSSSWLGRPMQVGGLGGAAGAPSSPQSPEAPRPMPAAPFSCPSGALYCAFCCRNGLMLQQEPDTGHQTAFARYPPSLQST